MKDDLKRQLDLRRGYALPLYRVPWFLRWRGAWRMPRINPDRRGWHGWVYITAADYAEIFRRA